MSIWWSVPSLQTSSNQSNFYKIIINYFICLKFFFRVLLLTKCFTWLGTSIMNIAIFAALLPINQLSIIYLNVIFGNSYKVGGTCNLLQWYPIVRFLYCFHHPIPCSPLLLKFGYHLCIVIFVVINIVSIISYQISNSTSKWIFINCNITLLNSI